MAREAARPRPRELGYETQPDVVIVGGGQGGIALGARLRQLGVPTIIVERNARPGDSWRKRYKSLCLHDPVWYDHLPYIKFPDELAGVLAEGQDRRLARDVHARDGAQLLGLHDGEERAATTTHAGEWTVVVERDGAEITLRPKQLVLATGMSGKPNVPEIPGMDVFKGDQHHSSQHPGPGRLQGQAGRRDRLEQLRARHLRRAVGGRRRRDDGAALVDPRRRARTR